MSYRWQVSSSPANPHLDAFLSQYYSLAVSLFLLRNSELTVTLDVINAFGYSNKTTGLVRILQGTLPGVQFAGGSAFTKVQEYYNFH